MSINTRSAFYYGLDITEDNSQLHYTVSGDDFVANIKLGSYFFSDLVTEIKRAMDEAGPFVFTVSLQRADRILTIASDENANTWLPKYIASDLWPLIGFLDPSTTTRAANRTQIGDYGFGYEFQPQFLLQSYVPLENFQERALSDVKESASGLVEVVSFGRRRFMECNITLQTAIYQGESAEIETRDINHNGEEELQEFLLLITEKGYVEFMPDRADKNTFFKLILESTSQSRDGTGFKIRELYSSVGAGYFESGLLTFREIDS